MANGVIIKSLSGFYYVMTENGLVECRARGKFRKDGTSPQVGDRVECVVDNNGKGRVDRIEPRKNSFIRPAVSNIDSLVFVAANTNPVTDPWLIDRVSVIAEAAGAELIICVNKTDLNAGEELLRIFTHAGFTVIPTSATNGEGIEELRAAIRGKVSAFTGNSGVGKSSLLNALRPGLALEIGEVSEKLGRGRHTTRHVELFDLGHNTYVADTPGFASFEIEMMETIPAEELQYHFPDFREYLGHCRFHDCSHRKEPECAVTGAVAAGIIEKSRYASYLRLYELAAAHKPWE